MSPNLEKSAWKRVSFGDVVRNVNVSVRDPEAVGIDRVVAMEHMDPGDLEIKRWGSLDEGTTFTRRVKPGQTLFGKRRAYQRKVAYAEFEAVCSGDILTFEADATQMLPEFLPFLVQSNEFFDHALGTSAGSLSPRTNWRDLSNFEFDLPPLEEQKDIADLLWSLSKYTSGVARQIAAAERLLYALVVTRGWHVQAAWPLRQLGSVMTEDSDFVSVDAEQQYPLVGVLNRGRGVLLREPIRGSETSYGSLNRVHSGQIIYSKLKAFEGSITVVPQQADGRFASQEFPTFSVMDDLDGEFFRLLTTLPEFWGMLSRASTGMGGRRERVKPRDFLRLELPLPPLEIQCDIVDHAREIEQAISGMSAELTALTSFNSALLADILGGN